MTPLPKRRLSHKRQGQRRASFSLENFTLQACGHCQKSALAHRVCPFCGYYSQRLVKAPKTKKAKNENRS